MRDSVFQLSTLAAVLAQTAAAAASPPLVERCPGVSTPGVACVNNYAAVLPLPFSRPSITGGVFQPEDSFNGTSVADASFDLVHNASFVVFDRERGLRDVLGPSPTLETVFGGLGTAVHEAPVYVPSLNAIVVSALAPDVVPQLLISLNGSQPTMTDYLPDPPVFGVNGGRYHKGKIYWAVGGGNFTFRGRSFRQVPGLYVLDPASRRVAPLLNNYFGQQFNSPDDLAVDPTNGDVFFTDPDFGFALGLLDASSLPVLRQNTYRFRPSTGAVSVVESSDVAVPNGIAISPDARTLYLTDTAIADFHLDPAAPVPRYDIVGTRSKCVYAFDLVDSPAGRYLANKRPIWYPEQFADDGFHAAANGFLVGAAGFSVDVLSQYGELLVKIQTSFYVTNIQFAGPKLDELWLFGVGEIARVKWNLQGISGDDLS
ncbi:hypothetical protein VTK73DRAFT_9327 [Phialemonium thermophilum]|uniref:SMP-30/Gluconolactonase/LRE-like region domain-containing protein n=1 Tax=Phialemonium thermophilum TaxID=223376 RepID=A0ABR3W2Y6_9PEZI